MQELHTTRPDPTLVSAHYATPAVQFEMAKACAMRECSALREQGMLRPFKMFRAKDVEFWMGRLRVENSPTDLYMSLLRVELPMLHADPPRMRQAGDLLLKTWPTLVRGYSWFADIDARHYERDFQRAKDAAIHGTEAARAMGLPAYPVFSGTGWNIRVDDYPYTGEVEGAPTAMRELARQVAEAAKEPFSNKKEANKTGLDLWFDNSVYDLRRIYRVPFSINTKSGLVVTPMTLGEARECSLPWFGLDGYADRWSVRDRLARVNDEARKAVA